MAISSISTMKETNWFYFFCIIPYRYDINRKIYVMSKNRQIFTLAIRICIPCALFMITSWTQPSTIFYNDRLWSFVYNIHLLLNVVTLYVSIFDNFWNARYHKSLLETFLVPDHKANFKIYRKCMIKMSALIAFYGYNEILQPFYMNLYGLTVIDLIIYMTYLYMEFLLILNMFYIDSLFQHLYQCLRNLRNVKLQKRSSKQFIEISIKCYKYICYKDRFSQVISIRLLVVAVNTFQATSALIFSLVRWIYVEPTSFTSWLQFNEIFIQAGGLCSQLVGFGCLCLEVEQCSNEVGTSATCFILIYHYYFLQVHYPGNQ